MTGYYKILLSGILMYSLTGVVFSDEAQSKAEQFTLRLAADGRPASLKVIPHGKELLNVQEPGLGFYLKGKGDALIPMQNVALEGDKLIVSAEFGTPEVTFTVKQTEKYVVLRIERLKSVSIKNDLTLHFEMNTDSRVRAIATDYMTDVMDLGNRITVDWKHLAHRNPDNPLGGFAIFYGDNAEEEDQALLHIWANENLAHPKVEGEWNYQAAKNWIAEWQEAFADQSRLWLDASSKEELYEGIKYAQLADVKEIFLFCNTWRGEVFWPEHKLNWEINTNVFPEGEKDVRRYSDELKRQRISLNFHYVSGGIGHYDPRYIGSKPDRRLASWGRGVLVNDVDGNDTTIHFLPDDDVELPYRLPTNAWMHLPSKSHSLQHVFDYETMRIGNELIKVGRFDDTDKPVWTLRDCQRGLYDTDAVGHLGGADMAGIITTYGINFIPDNDSTLLYEIAENYAGMLNRCGVGHAEFDGAEIHTYNGRMWGYHKFAELVYRNLDHPVTSSSSSAIAPPCFIEYKFNSTRKLLGKGGYHGYGAPIILEQPSRLAGSRLDAQWALSLMAAENYRRFNVSKPEPLFGISIDMFKGLGITEDILTSVRDWKAASGLMTEQQRQIILNTLSFPASPLNLASSQDAHPASPIVHTVHKSGQHYEIIPVKVLTREKGDILWRSGQEHGPVAPRQYIKPGDELMLENIYDAQPVQFIIRVMWATNYEDPHNIDLQPSLSQISDRRDTQFSEDGNTLEIAYENPRSEAIWEEYKLPYFPVDVNLIKHRGIGMYITGDDSNAILVYQIPGRDYVVPINFKGRKYIEIPNGEAAWANGYWGWRMDSKRTDYSQVKWSRIGFGHLPPQTSAKIKVEGIKALHEAETLLVNPSIHTGSGQLQVKGSIVSGQYLEYKSGKTANVYDKNWNKLKELPVESINYEMSKGWSKVLVRTSQKEPLPWLDVQFMTQGESMKLQSGNPEK